MITPCGIYMKPTRNGGFRTDLPLADSAQPMDSSKRKSRVRLQGLAGRCGG